jgi:hypothetical protein
MFGYREDGIKQQWGCDMIGDGGYDGIFREINQQVGHSLE